jgi:pyroglutamyl-peptidase
MPTTILLTGFGPFPGAPFNPSAALARALARRRRPAFANAEWIAHVFPTAYAAVDRELPRLLARHEPDIVLLFGLATHTRHLRVETRAQNAIATLIPDAHRGHRTRVIAPGAPRFLNGRAPFRRLVAAGRGHGVSVQLSRDAGRYLCNYAYWRALEAAAIADDPPVVQFIHIPLVRRSPRAPGKRSRPTLDALVRPTESMLVALLAAARR